MSGTSATSEQKQKILEICYQVRDLLQKDGLEFEEFPIEELSNKRSFSTDQHGTEHLGFCETRWRVVEAGRRELQTVAVHLRLEKSNGELFSLNAILPTFLHELAHALEKQISQGRTDAHGPQFYQVFADVLKRAERLRIFSLPTRPNKFAPDALRRYDALDFAVISAEMCGTSVMFQPPSENEPLRVTLVHGAKHTKKLVVIPAKQRKIYTVQSLARQKFQTKFAIFRIGNEGQSLLDLSEVRSGDEIWCFK